MAISADDPEPEIEEERRLCYVGITRAMKELQLSAARARMVRGETQYNRSSRFIEEIPRYLLNYRGSGRAASLAPGYSYGTGLQHKPGSEFCVKNGVSDFVIERGKAAAVKLPDTDIIPAPIRVRPQGGQFIPRIVLPEGMLLPY